MQIAPYIRSRRIIVGVVVDRQLIDVSEQTELASVPRAECLPGPRYSGI